jgi:hypothetical protein
MQPVPRYSQNRLEPPPGAFRDRSEPPRHRLFPLVGVDVEVLGAKGAKTKARIVTLRGRHGGGRQQDQYGEKAPTRSSTGEHL